MRKLLLSIMLLSYGCIVISACTDQLVSTAAPPQTTVTPQATVAPPPTIPRQPEVEFQSDGSASLSIPSLNGNEIAVRLAKPNGEGPFPVLIGVAGGDGYFAFQWDLQSSLAEKGIMSVDFAPQGRGGSEGEDNHHGYVHQDDLKAVVNYVSGLSFVQQDNIGILSYSFGVVLATGALARYPGLPVAFLIDWEGPACPGTDFQRGLENDEAWASAMLAYFNYGDEVSPEELQGFMLHGGSLFDQAYWEERDASRFIAEIPCPYLRVQFDQDHAQGAYKYHMLALVNTSTAKSGQWTRLNDNPANITYSVSDLSRVYFHTYRENEFASFNSADSESVDEVLLAYIEEMFFSKPYEQ